MEPIEMAVSWEGFGWWVGGILLGYILGRFTRKPNKLKQKKEGTLIEKKNKETKENPKGWGRPYGY